MEILKDYEGTLVVQRNPITGCIPSAIEWMMKYKGVEVPNNFQEKYDLENQKIAENTFKTVHSAVLKTYSKLNFEFLEFDNGKDKLAHIEKRISEQIPCLISITQSPTGGWHIVPVVEIDSTNVFVLWMDTFDIVKQIKRRPRRNLEMMHDRWPGGKDILALL